MDVAIRWETPRIVPLGRVMTEPRASGARSAALEQHVAGLGLVHGGGVECLPPPRWHPDNRSPRLASRDQAWLTARWSPCLLAPRREPNTRMPLMCEAARRSRRRFVGEMWPDTSAAAKSASRSGAKPREKAGLPTDRRLGRDDRRDRISNR